MDKEGVVYVYTLEYYLAIKRDEIMPFAATWMDLGIILQSDVQTNIIQYHVYVKSKRMVQMNLFTKEKQTHRHRKQTYGYHSREGEGSLLGV